MGYGIFLIIYIFFIVFCFEEDWYILGTILSAIPVFAVIAIIISNIKAKEKREAQR